VTVAVGRARHGDLVTDGQFRHGSFHELVGDTSHLARISKLTVDLKTGEAHIE
jgi:hypothetical protein